MSRVIARWESRSGRWYAELTRYTSGRYGYQGDGAGGVLGVRDDDAAAIAAVQRLVDMGYFQPDANTLAMRRVL